MPSVTEELDLPASANPSGITVRITLKPEIGYVGTPATIVGAHEVTPDADGSWAATLVANSLITPAGSVYVVQLEGLGRSERRYISVPDVAGPVTLQSCLTDPPGALTPSALALHLADTADAHDASAISFSPTGTIAATDVQAAIAEVASEAGGGGAPTGADYLVGTAQAGLSAEIVVGATPGGELGGTWASPTVDATHSGSSHASVQAAAEATAAAALTAHEGAADPHTGYLKEADASSTYVQVANGLVVVGDASNLITDEDTARPVGAAAVLWLMATGVTPNNATDGDLIWTDGALSALVETVTASDGSIVVDNTDPENPEIGRGVYVWDGDSYELTTGRKFVGPADPDDNGFTMADGDHWLETA